MEYPEILFITGLALLGLMVNIIRGGVLRRRGTWAGLGRLRGGNRVTGGCMSSEPALRLVEERTA